VPKALLEEREVLDPKRKSRQLGASLQRNNAIAEVLVDYVTKCTAGRLGKAH
jgi:hypothetical protein